MLAEQLAKMELFHGMERSDLRQLERRMHRIRVPADVLLLREGDSTGSLYCVIEGAVRVFVSQSAKREVTLCTLRRGEHFGEISLLDGGPHSASVASIEPSELVMLSGEEFDDFLVGHPQCMRPLLRTLSGRIRRLTRHTRNLALLDVYGRIVSMLDEQAVADGDRRIIRERLTHQKIALYVGASREMVSRIMKDLVSGGYVRSESGRYVISDSLPRAW